MAQLLNDVHLLVAGVDAARTVLEPECFADPQAVAGTEPEQAVVPLGHSVERAEHVIPIGHPIRATQPAEQLGQLDPVARVVQARLVRDGAGHHRVEQLEVQAQAGLGDARG
jgi:hypothetical protein